MEQPRNIKIFTRSMNLALYHKAMALCTLPYERVRLVGTSADGYLYRLIADTSADYAVNIDEDAFVTDNGALQRLLDYCMEKGYACCGMPDGGMVEIRRGNPLVTNPFFNVFHTALLRQEIDGQVPEEIPLESRFSMKESFTCGYDFQETRREPYYPLMIWMANHHRVLYLRATTSDDGVSTILYNHLDEPFLIHTWYSREYNKCGESGRRIDRAFRQACFAQGRKPRLPLSDTLRTWSLRTLSKAVLLKKQYAPLLHTHTRL